MSGSDHGARSSFCPLCRQPSEVAEPQDPAIERRGPRLDETGRRRARVHYTTKERTRGFGAFRTSERFRFPMLRLCGNWLEDAGFRTGDPIAVEVQDGRLIIEAVG